MKKKIVLGLCILLTFFFLTGCDSKKKGTGEKEDLRITFHDLKYLEPEYSNKHTSEEEGDVLEYLYEEEDKEIKLVYSEGKSYDDISAGSDYKEVTLHDTTWRVYRTQSSGVVNDTYYTVYKDNLYSMVLYGVDQYYDEFQPFLDSVEMK